MATETVPYASPNAPPQTPKWVGWLVASSVFLFVLAIIGWVVWSYVSAPKQSELVEVQGEYRSGMAVRSGTRIIRQAPPVNLDGIRQQLPTSYLGRAGDVLLRATKGPKDSDWVLVMNYNRGDLLNPDQTAALTARLRLSTDPTFAKSLKVTDEQVGKLRNIGAATNMALSDDHKQKLKAGWDAYLAASDKSGPEQALLALMREIGTASLDATKKQIEQRVQEVQQILTPEQIAAFKQ